MPQHQWRLTEEHLTLLGVVWLGTFAICPIPVTFQGLLRHRLSAELCLEVGNITVLLSSLATH